MKTNLTDWLAQSDSRETSPEILAAIFAVAENHNEETLDAIWNDPERYDVLVTIYEIVTQNGLTDSTDFFCCVERVPSFAVMHPCTVGFAECPSGPFAVQGALWVAAIAA